MNILFHLTSPPPRILNTDAVFQEVESLRSRVGGNLLNVYPFKSPRPFFPRLLYGLHKIHEIRRSEQNFDIHHLFAANLYPFPYLMHFKKPLLFSVTAGLNPRQTLMTKKRIKALHTIVINNERDQALLKALKIPNYCLIRPGIDTSKFNFSFCPFRTEFVLLVGSAPWIQRQFHQKGIDLLLEAACKIPHLKLIFLWRGLLLKELEQRISSCNLTHKTEIISEKADVNKILARVHATVVLAEQADVVKAYPHSLLESLAAGKPVLLNNTIPMSDYVSEMKCGEVVSTFTIDDLTYSLHNLIQNYDTFQNNALVVGKRDFSIERHLADFVNLYNDVLK